MYKNKLINSILITLATSTVLYGNNIVNALDIESKDALGPIKIDSAKHKKEIYNKISSPLEEVVEIKANINKTKDTEPILLSDFFSRSNLVKDCNIESDKASASLSLNLENNLNNFYSAVEGSLDSASSELQNVIDSYFRA